MSGKQGPRWLGTAWGRFGLLVGVLVLLWIVASALWSGIARPLLIEHGVPEAWRQLYGEPPPLVEERPVPIRKANINGVPIAIPSNYLALVGIEYKDQSTWAPRDPDTPKPDERTFEDEAHAFTLAVRWPDLKPRSSETDQSYWGRGDPDGDPWLQIGLGAYSDPDAIGRDLGWAPVVRGRIEMIEGRTHTRRLPPRTSSELWGETETVHIRYEMRGTDPETGLKWAEPVGPGTERFHTWNQTLHWKGDLDGYVSNMIKCYNGEMPNPESRPVCRHRFKLPEWGARLAVTYPRDQLPQWRKIRSDVRELILGFEAKPDDLTEKDSTSTHKESD